MAQKKYRLTPLRPDQPGADMLFVERETGSTHLPFSTEYLLCTAIKNGDEELTDKVISETLSQEINTGSLSESPLMQTKYWAVTVIANAVHYAILGGLDETDAYNMSDRYIRDIDSFTDPDRCVDYLVEKAHELVSAVKNAKAGAHLSTAVRKTIHHIHVHLHDRITVVSLAEKAGLSPDYLSHLFKKETGLCLHEYIVNERLTEAESLLAEGKKPREIAYTLGFAGQSHFTEAFKRKYGTTPAKYKTL